MTSIGGVFCASAVGGSPASWAAGRAGAKSKTDAADSHSSTADVLDLSTDSQAAPSCGSLTASLFGTPPGEVVDLVALQQETQASVRGRLASLFAENGIDTSTEIRLQTDACGRVVVCGEHPQKAEIEQLFEDDPQLRNDFVKSQGLASLIAAGRQAHAFQQAYAKNPQAAVAQYWYLFSDSSQPSTTFSILGDEYKTLFERPGSSSQVFETKVAT